MLSIGMNQCRCVVQALVGFDVNVPRLVGRLDRCIDGDLVVLEMWRVNLLRRRARKNICSIVA